MSRKIKREAQKWQNAKGHGSKGSGRVGSTAKKREYQNHCRTMRVAGMVNDAFGGWMTNAAAIGAIGEKRTKMVTGR